jgi:hypothetical protein
VQRLSKPGGLGRCGRGEELALDELPHALVQYDQDFGSLGGADAVAAPTGGVLTLPGYDCIQAGSPHKQAAQQSLMSANGACLAAMRIHASWNDSTRRPCAHTCLA